MKKKIVSLCLVVCLLATAVIGGTLAYFTDSEQATNVMTVGHVDITLKETFDQNAKLLPGTSTENEVEKDVWVGNDGTEDTYVRLHIALPKAMIDQNMNSYNDMLHWNFSADAYAPGKWSLQDEMTDTNGWTGNGTSKQWTYNTTIDNADYTVWVVTYRTALGAGVETEQAMSQVYLDWRTDADANDDGTITYTKPNYDAQGNKLEGVMQYTCNGALDVKVFAEATQTSEGFTDAYDALNTVFGVPGSVDYTNPWSK